LLSIKGGLSVQKESAFFLCPSGALSVGFTNIYKTLIKYQLNGNKYHLINQ